MANSRISNVAAIAADNAVVDLLDGGPAAGTVEIRTGAPPTNLLDADTGVLLGTLTLSDPAFGGATDQNPGAQAAANAITGDTSADANGIAGHFRGKDSTGVAVIQGDVTVTGGGGDMQLDNTNIAIGQAINMTAWLVNHPES